jgi:hypothetical protein
MRPTPAAPVKSFSDSIDRGPDWLQKWKTINPNGGSSASNGFNVEASEVAPVIQTSLSTSGGAGEEYMSDTYPKGNQYRFLTGGAAAAGAAGENTLPTAGGLQEQADRLNGYAKLLNNASADAIGRGDKVSAAAYRREAISNAQVAAIYSSSASSMVADQQRSIPAPIPVNDYGPQWSYMGENSAGFNQPGIRPNYVAVNGGGLGYGGGIALNVDDGSVYAGGGGGLPLQPGTNAVVGFIIGNTGRFSPDRAAQTNDFLGGAGSTGGVSLFGIYAGFNHSYGGATAIEIGIASPGVTRTPNPGVGGGFGVSLPVGKIPGFGQ